MLLMKKNSVFKIPFPASTNSTIHCTPSPSFHFTYQRALHPGKKRFQIWLIHDKIMCKIVFKYAKI